MSVARTCVKTMNDARITATELSATVTARERRCRSQSPISSCARFAERYAHAPNMSSRLVGTYDSFTVRRYPFAGSLHLMQRSGRTALRSRTTRFPSRQYPAN